MRYLLILLVLAACSGVEKKSVDIQGHRGARGLMPENTIPAFIHAIELGVTTLELDLVVSADSQLVVSHEPWFSHEMCVDLSGERIASDTLYNIFKLPYSEIQKFDCGSISHPRFPDQTKMTIGKPLLSEVVETVEKYLQDNNLPSVYYNIELKTREGFDNIYHPTPEVFSDLVYREISRLGIWGKANIQSFDFRTLQYFNEKYPEVKLAMLIEEEKDWRVNIEKLGFTPEIYSCYYELLSQEIVKNLQKEGMDVIPWTVNDTKDMQQLKSWGVDGIITDYPDRAIQL